MLRERLERARLYLVTDTRHNDLEKFLAGALEGGVDVVQLRDKRATDDELRRVASVFRSLCNAHDALFILNDRPELAQAYGADGVHVGQDDAAVAEVRALVGPDMLIGLSTHSPEQVDAVAGVDYFAVGPVHATPTKPEYAPVGSDLVRYASEHAPVPFFAIGGINAGNVGEVIAAGAKRVAVVRAITDAGDPGSAARELRAPLEQDVRLEA